MNALLSWNFLYQISLLSLNSILLKFSEAEFLAKVSLSQFQSTRIACPSSSQQSTSWYCILCYSSCWCCNKTHKNNLRRKEFEYRCTVWAQKLLWQESHNGRKLKSIIYVVLMVKRYRKMILVLSSLFFFLFHSKYFALEWCNPQRLVHPFSAKLIKITPLRHARH